MNDASDTARLGDIFRTRFGSTREPPRRFFAPGRVNLIGDHTDYTGGLAFPCAVDLGTTLLIRAREDRRFRFASTNFEREATLDPDELGRRHGESWINYPLGVIDQLSKAGVSGTGFDCLYSGNVPNGAGLSSSASIEVVTALALDNLLGLGLTRLEMVDAALRAENDFVGMPCGVLDQYAVAMAEASHAMLLDCHTLSHRQVPLALHEHVIIVTNSHQRRELGESAYDERVAECARALRLLRNRLDIDRLGVLTPDAYEGAVEVFADDPVAGRRARHVVYENARVRAAVPLLEREDLAGFGALMDASHDSLRDDYASSTDTIDRLVDIAREVPGVLGSRITGGGFGGCTVSLVGVEAVEHFRHEVGERYTAATGLVADFIIVRPGPGAMEITA